MPSLRRHLEIGAFDLLPAALDHAVEADIVLERIGAHHVIVVGISEPHCDAPSGKRLSVRSVLDCSMARPLGEVVSATTAHCPGPPWPVRPKSKSSGGAPT